jgi:hypothetical protein
MAEIVDRRCKEAERRVGAALSKMDQGQLSIRVVALKMVSQTLSRNSEQLWSNEQQQGHQLSRTINDTAAKVGLGHVRVPWKLSYVSLRLTLRFILVAINIRHCQQLLKAPSVRTWNVWLQHSCSDERVFC